MKQWRRILSKELKETTRDIIQISCDCSISGRDLPFLNDRDTFEKRGQDQELRVECFDRRDPQP